jgi:hypothetical protein
VIALAAAPKTSGSYYVPVNREDAGSKLARNDKLAQKWMQQTDALLAEKGYKY